MPDLGIGETIAALAGSGGGWLSSLFGAGEAAAGGLAAEGALGAEAGLGAGLGAAEAGGALSGLAGGAEAAGGLAGLGEGAGFGLGDLAATATAGGPAFDVAAGGGIEGLTAAGAPATPSLAEGSALSKLIGSGSGLGAATTGESLAPAIGAEEGAAGGGKSLLDSLIGGAKSQITGSPLTTALGVGGLGFSAMNQMKGSEEEKKLKTAAGTLSAQAQQFLSGNLPPDIRAGIEQKLQARRAAIIQNAARTGMGTDPSTNSALAQDLANADQLMMTELAQLQEQYIRTGMTELGMSNDLLRDARNFNAKTSAETGKAIMALAAAFNKGTPRPATV